MSPRPVRGQIRTDDHVADHGGSSHVDACGASMGMVDAQQERKGRTRVKADTGTSGSNVETASDAAEQNNVETCGVW